MKTLVDIQKMRIEVLFLFMVACKICAQPPLEISEGQEPGKLDNFTCNGNGTIEGSGIQKSYFLTNTSGSQTFVYLTKKIDLKNNNSFPVTSGSECLKQVNLSMSIKYKCNSQTPLQIHIKPNQDHKPNICDTSCNRFIPNQLKLSISENTTVNSVVQSFKLCSEDMNVASSSLGMMISGILGESNKKSIILLEELDYENQTANLNSEVSINGIFVLNITIIVKDSDDLGVSFSKIFYDCLVPENEKGIMQNCSVVAEDMDKGIMAPINYSLISVTPKATGKFHLHQNGTLELKAALDREKIPVYQLFIKGYQTDRPNDRVNYTTMQITVTDVNDNPPQMTEGQYNSSIVENSPIGTIVCQVSATDIDEGENAENEFYIDSSNKYFDVDKKTGLVKVKSMIDRESAKSNPITFQIYAASVLNTTIRSNKSSVIVSILDENDNSPRFTNVTTIVTIDKTHNISVPITKVTATDPDKAENGKIRYSITNPNDPFNIDSNSGTVMLNHSLNDAFSPSYNLVINATDQSANVNNRRSSVLFMTINVSDVNTHTPYFKDMPKSIDISEDAVIGTILMEVKAGDADPTDHLSFTLHNDIATFDLKNNTLRIKSKLDRETSENYTLTISVSDSKHVKKTTVQIKVIDVNDNTPIFENIPYKFTVVEERNDVNVGVVKATDQDIGQNGKIEYYIDPDSPWYHNFTVKNETGQIATIGKIDREQLENGNSIHIFVFATDQGSPPRTNSSSIEITVLDINDHVPQFLSYFRNNFTIKEDVQLNSNVFQVSAVDPDYGINGSVLYSIRWGNISKHLFSINDSTGVIRLTTNLTSVPCNDRTIIFNIDAYNPNSMERNSTLTITCNIQDVNNWQPVFLYSSNKCSIRESNDIIGEDIDLCFNNSRLSVRRHTPCNVPAAKDEDCETPYNTLFYWMNNNDTRFQINSSTGIISIKKGSSLNYDNPHLENIIKFKVFATDALYTATTTLTVQITNSPEFPEFSKETFFCSVQECPNTKINCSLSLRNENDIIGQEQFHYNISSKGSTHFGVKPTGKVAEIFLTKCYDFENISSHTFLLDVEARANFGNTRTSCKVNITLENINDNEPVFGNKTYTFSIFETYKKGYILGNINASDADHLGRLTYTLENNDYLNYSDGSLKLYKEPDLDNGDIKSELLKARIFAFDGKFNVSADIDVTVKPVNEYPPEFEQPVYNFNVSENDSHQFTIQAHDNDTGHDGHITMHFIPDKWSKNVSLVNNSIITIHGFDREAMGNSNLIQLSVEAADGGTPARTGIAVVEIIVEGINDNIPKFSAEDKTVVKYLQEGTEAHVEVFTSKASDDDIGTGSQVLYRLKSPDFQINTTSGAIVSTKNLLITKENNGNFSITVEAFNSGTENNFDSQNISFILQDINNNKPKFVNSTYQHTVSECTKPGLMQIRVSASDADTSVEFNTVTYWVEDKYNETFYIDSKSGQIYLSKLVDFDPPKNQRRFSFMAYATDDLRDRDINSDHTSNATISISVTGCNDNFPVFEKDQYTCTIQENKNGTFNCTLKATDVDGDNLTYELVTAPKQNFSVTTKSCTISVVSPFDFDVMQSKDIILNVSACDGIHKSFTSVVVHVTDENDIRPVFWGAPYTFSVFEDITANRSILGAVNVTDADSKVVTLAFANCTDILEVMENGNIVALGKFDYETKQRHTCIITANDTINSFVSNTITINVIDKNDNVPVFNQSSCKSVVVNETMETGKLDCRVLAHDNDKSSIFNTIAYSIISGNNKGLLTINNSSGEITTIKTLEHYGGQTLALVIKAADNGNPPLARYTNVSIEIRRSNMHRPEFLNTPYKATIRENQSNVSVLQVIAKDEDGDKLDFKVVNATNDFHFDQNKLMCSHGLDAEETGDICYVQIRVSDGRFNNTATVAVTVLDENDNDPYFVANTVNSITVNDTTNPGTLICEVTAADEDISNNGFTYILTGDRGDFRINRTTGRIFLLNRFGRNGQFYHMSVVVADSGVPSKYNNTSFEIAVKETNQPFTFTNKTLILHFRENSASVNASLAVDQPGLNRNLSYSIVSHKISILKMFDFNTSSASLTLANKSNFLDFEQQSNYSFIVTAKDNGVFPKTSTATIVVNVVDVNEPPKITKYDATVLKEVNTSADAFISKVETNDPDTNTTFKSLKFTLSDNINFTVNDSGNITVKATRLEVGNYTLKITVTDGGNLSDSKTTLIIVPNVNYVSFNSTVNENTSKPVLISNFPTHLDSYEVTYTIISSRYSGYFQMGENGSLILTKALDREVTDSVHIRLLGRETSYGIMIAERKVSLILQDINDCPPEFLNSQYIVTVDDVTRNGTVIATTGVVDRDMDKGNRNLTFSTDNGNFSIDNKGNLMIIDSSSLSIGNLSFNISVTDGEFTRKASVVISVTDTNNHSPEFVNSTYRFNIAETNNTNVTVGTLSARDQDNGRNGLITFSLLHEKEPLPFRVSSLNNNSCIIITDKPIDRETQGNYSLIIAATDHGENPRQNVKRVFIDVLDVNDNYPKFEGASSFEGSVLENSKNNTSINLPTITVTDLDSGANGEAGIIYTFNDTKAPICIMPMKPSIYVCGNIDREEKGIYYLEIIATDSKGDNDSHSTSVPLTVLVLDVNDEPPQFTENVYQYNISENANTSESVGNVIATDRDEGGHIKYTITSGDDGKFYLNPFTGIIYVGGNIDRETTSEYSLNISASDGLHSTSTLVDISISDMNDNPPEFFMATFQEAVTVEVEENTKSGLIFNATAFDWDDPESNNSRVLYNLSVSSSGDESYLFEMKEDGGLRISKPLDREAGDYYIVNITATDQGTPALSTSIFVHVKVLDVNDNRPEICIDGQCHINTSNCYTVEKVPKYSVLKLIGSKDVDAGQNSTVSYSIESSDISKYFKIDNNTGVVVVAEPLVVNNLIHEGLSLSKDTVVVNLTIVATDGGGLNSTMTLQVFVEPLNDEDVPVFSESVFKFNISETNNTDVLVGNCTATTNDTNSHMKYELISGYEKYLKAFEIDQSTGVIRTTAPLDREKVERYTFAVQVRDGRVPERTAFAAVEITINDINDNSPTFVNDNITITVHENATVFIQKQIYAYDKDEGVNAEIMYTLSFTNDSVFQENDVLFNISEGIFTVNGIFDYEQQTKYDIAVTAVDTGVSPLSGTAEVHVVVVDMNDNSPVFVNNKHFYNISEDKTSSEIFTATATDEDSGWNGQIVYKLLNTEYLPFVIDPFNGTVYLHGKLDYETRKSYSLTIVAQDMGSSPRSTTKKVTIYVEDVYDDKLLFPKDTFDITVLRSTKVNTSLLNLTVSVSGAFFSLKGQQTDYFHIGNNSGELVLVKPLSDGQEQYAFQVIARDGHRQNASCTIILHVLGHQVTFNTTEMKVNVTENLNGTTVLVDLNTTRELSGKGVVYAIVDITPQVSDKDVFKVNRSTGIVSCTKALDREKHAQYTISISAQTQDTRQKREVARPSSIIRLVVNVGDVNDNPPHFTSDQDRIFGVPDDVRANYVVGTIQAEDPDISDDGQLRYTAIGGSTDVFGVVEETGDIITKVAIASTRKLQLNLLINASDGNVMNENATLNVTVYVVPTKNQPILLVKMTVAEFKKREDVFRRNMSEILGVKIQFERIEPHQITESNGGTHIDLSETDLIFHGINETSGKLLPNRDMKKLLEDPKMMEKLSALFGQMFNVIDIQNVYADPSAITASQILLICMAVFIFFGSLTALIVAQYSWLRYETEKQQDEKEVKRIENEIELSTIRSRQSSKLSSVMAAAAINPAYAETELITSNGRLSPEMKSEPQYESQELRANFEEEPLEAYLNGRNPPDTAHSVIDSGVGNTSVHSEGNRPESSSSETEGNRSRQARLQVSDGIPVNAEGPVMTSSPRVSRNDITAQSTADDSDLKQNKNGMDISQGKRSRGESLLLLDATGESETDDTIDDDDDVGDDNDANKVVNTNGQDANVGEVPENQVIMSANTTERNDDAASTGGAQRDEEESKHEDSDREDKVNIEFESTSF